jgi:hypothetical protein
METHRDKDPPERPPGLKLLDQTSTKPQDKRQLLLLVDDWKSGAKIQIP